MTILRRLIILVLLCMGLCGQSALALPKKGDADKKLPKLVRKLVDVKELKGVSIGIVDISGPGPEEGSFQEYLTGLVESELVRGAAQQGYRVFDRGNLEKLAAEWKLQLSGAVDPASAVKVGQLVGVNTLLLGSYVPGRRSVQVRLSLVDTETGRILSSEYVSIRKGPDIAKLLKDDEAAAKAHKGRAGKGDGDLSIKVWTDLETYSIGDTLAFHFEASEDCYVTLIDVGTSGKANILFPNRYYTDNFVKGGKTYDIPWPEAGFKIRVTPPAGIELVRAIASKKPVSSLAFLPPEGGMFAPIEKDLPLLTRDLSVEAAGAPASEWVESVMRIRIE